MPPLTHATITLPAPDIARPHGPNDGRAIVGHWQALVDANLIGSRPPTPPELAALRAANERVVLGRRRESVW